MKLDCQTGKHWMDNQTDIWMDNCMDNINQTDNCTDDLMDNWRDTLRSPAIQRNDILVDNLTKIDWQSAARCTVWT